MPEPRRHRLLVVDDAPDTREVLHRNLTSRGYEVVTAGDVAEALAILSASRVDLVITDLKMPGASGLELVRHVRDQLKGAEVITITGYPSVEGAVAAMKSGAEEYLTKPFTQDELFAAVALAIEKLSGEPPPDREPARRSEDGQDVVAVSEAMQRALAAVAEAAAGTAPVLLTGEHGTGKTTLARLVHEQGAHASLPFVVVRCGDSRADWLERRLFGDALAGPGAGAIWRPGLLQTLEGGTVLLDDVSDLPASVQRRLAEALAVRRSPAPTPPGPAAPRCRLLAASSEDLRGLVVLGAFREDLYLRLSAASIAVPPLRERAEDVLPLVRQFLARHARARRETVPTLSDRAQDVLQGYPWPGNLAELANSARALAGSAQGAVVDVPQLPEALRAWAAAAAGASRSLAEVEANHIRSVLASVGGHKTRAAEILGINRKTLREKLRDGDTDTSSG